jgi:GAF domain-containing protein
MGTIPEQSGRRGGRSAEAAPRTAGTDGDLSQRLAGLARDMQHQIDNTAVMDLIVATVVGTVPGAEEATISLVEGRRRVVSAAASGEVARRFDDLQQETQQGPYLDAIYEHETVRVDDLTRDPRWPALARRAGELGLSSMLCFQLYVIGDDLGALNLFARRPRAFRDESERVGLLYASHAAVAVAQAQKVTHLATALASRDVIGQAKGILMERYKVTADQAFALLAKVSPDTNCRLHDVAGSLARTGVLDAEGGEGELSEPGSR